MAIFVLIPGGWHGGWAFAGFAATLRRHGHDVYTPTLSGLDEGSRQSPGGINLETHISDVQELLTVEDLYEVVLCAHSYGGMVATGVADRACERIAALVYLDAFVPEDGQSWWDLAGDGYRRLALDRSRRDGIGVTPPDGLDRRCAPHPIAAFLQEIWLSGRAESVFRRVFVYASDWEATPFTEQYERFRDDPAWEVHSIACGHDIIRHAPDEILAILQRLAAAL